MLEPAGTAAEHVQQFGVELDEVLAQIVRIQGFLETVAQVDLFAPTTVMGPDAYWAAELHHVQRQYAKLAAGGTKLDEGAAFCNGTRRSSGKAVTKLLG